MAFRTLVTQGPGVYLKLRRLAKLYPQCRIESPRVEAGTTLGENVRVAHDAELRSNVRVGRWTYIEPFSFVNAAKIGAFCAIGRNVAIGGFEHPYLYPTVSPRLYRELLGTGYDDSPPPLSLGTMSGLGRRRSC